MAGSHIDTVLNGGDVRRLGRRPGRARMPADDPGRGPPPFQAAGGRRLHRRGRQPGRRFPRQPGVHRRARSGALEKGTTAFGVPSRTSSRARRSRSKRFSARPRARPKSRPISSSTSSRARSSTTRAFRSASSTSSPASTTAGARSSAKSATPGRSRSSSGATRSSAWPISPSGHPARGGAPLRQLRHHRQGPRPPGAFSIVPGRADFSFEFRSRPRKRSPLSNGNCSCSPRTWPRRAAWLSSRGSWTRPTPVVVPRPADRTPQRNAKSSATRWSSRAAPATTPRSWPRRPTRR